RPSASDERYPSLEDVVSEHAHGRLLCGAHDSSRLDDDGARPVTDADVVVIGAGVIGLACAAELARRGHDVVVIERHEGPARETSARNSGVVHAGIYDAPGSLKARACVEGRALLEARCARDGVPFRRVGKLIVATDPREVPVLEALLARGLENGAALSLI